MLEVFNLTKRYRGKTANDRLCFTVEPGEIAMLAGPNGAGKTTALKCIAGLLRCEGDVRICGYPGQSRGAKRRLGYVPDLPAPFDLLTVWEHLEFIARVYRLREWEPRAAALLDRLALTERRDGLGRALSKGMRQKLAICMALLPRPRVLLLDEPFAGLDPHAVRALGGLLSALRAEGGSVLVSTHMLESMRPLWDKALVMDRGRIAAMRTRGELEAVPEAFERLFFSITGDPAAPPA